MRNLNTIRKILIILAIVATAMLLALNAGRIRPFSPSGTKVNEKASYQKESTRVLPPAKGLETLSNAEIDSLVQGSTRGRAPKGINLEVVVNPGDTVIADAYEASSGEIVCTKLTPALKTLMDGTTITEVTIESVGMTIAGETRKIFSRVGSHHSIGANDTLTIAEPNPDGMHSVTMTAKVKNDGKIYIRAVGQFARPGQ